MLIPVIFSELSNFALRFSYICGNFLFSNKNFASFLKNKLGKKRDVTNPYSIMQIEKYPPIYDKPC